MLEKLLSFSRHHKMALLMLLDALLLPLAMWSAVLLRLGGNWDPKLDPYWWIFAVPPLWVLPIFIKLGLYRAVLKFLDDRIVYTVLVGQLQHLASGVAGAIDQLPFGDLQGQLAGGNAVAMQGLIGALEKEGGFEVRGADVDRQVALRVGLEPIAHLLG